MFDSELVVKEIFRMLIKVKVCKANRKNVKFKIDRASTLAEFFSQCILLKTTRTLKVYLIDLSVTILKCQILL